MNDNINLICEECSSERLRVDTDPTGAGTLICNDCGHFAHLDKDEVTSVLARAGWFDSFRPKSIMEAVLRYDSVESASGPMTLGMLYDAVTEALEKGMPKDSEVFESSTEAPIEGVRFLFETDRVSPIECGSHIYPEKAFDILIDTHECPENH
jgi:hypothetical protein